MKCTLCPPGPSSLTIGGVGRRRLDQQGLVAPWSSRGAVGSSIAGLEVNDICGWAMAVNARANSWPFGERPRSSCRSPARRSSRSRSA